jgi:hypothetical protein
MRSFHNRRLAAFGLVISLAVAACSGPKSPEGTWMSDTGEEKLEFLDKGEVFVTGPDGTFAGKWEVVESGQVKVTFVGRGASFGDQICDFKIEKRELSLSGNCGLQGTYQRQS